MSPQSDVLVAYTLGSGIRPAAIFRAHAVRVSLQLVATVALVHGPAFVVVAPVFNLPIPRVVESGAVLASTIVIICKVIKVQRLKKSRFAYFCHEALNPYVNNSNKDKPIVDKDICILA